MDQPSTNPINDPADIRNWQRRDENCTTSGKLTAGDPARLAAIGVRHVVNLALDDHPESLADESALLAKHGIAYSHIPVPFNAPTQKHYRLFKQALNAVDGPVHVHCIMNYRVTAFFYLLDIENGQAEQKASERMIEVWDPLASDDPLAQPWRKLLEEQI